MYVINQSLPAREAGLLGGMILGEVGGLDRNFYESLKNTGVVHLVIVSGSNVILLASNLIEGLAGEIGRKKAIALAMIITWGYVGIVGWEAPVLRAALLVSVFYWAQILGRKYDWWRSLLVTVLILALADQRIVTSVSFWLSLVAYLGVVSMKGRLIDSTVWVGIWVTPILAMIFGRISLIGPVANIMVLVLTEVITVVGGIGAIIGVVVLPLGKGILWLLYPLLKYFAWVVEGLGNLGWISVGIRFNVWMMIGWYLILAWVLLRRRDEK